MCYYYFPPCLRLEHLLSMPSSKNVCLASILDYRPHIEEVWICWVILDAVAHAREKEEKASQWLSPFPSSKLTIVIRGKGPTINIAKMMINEAEADGECLHVNRKATHGNHSEVDVERFDVWPRGGRLTWQMDNRPLHCLDRTGLAL